MVSTFRSQLERRFGARLREVRLFGSAARGEMNEDSDVDVLVVLDDMTVADRNAVFDIVGELRLETDLLLSPTVMDTKTCAKWREQERPLMNEIQRDGVPF